MNEENMAGNVYAYLVDDLGLCTSAVHGDGDHLVTMRAIVPILIECRM